MKKIYLLFIILAMFLITGCGKNKILDIKVEDINACIDNFDINSYTFKVVYEDREEAVYMSLDYFGKEDQNKFLERGDHLVTLVYEGFEKTFNLILEFFNKSYLSLLAIAYSKVFILVLLMFSNSDKLDISFNLLISSSINLHHLIISYYKVLNNHHNSIIPHKVCYLEIIFII